MTCVISVMLDRPSKDQMSGPVSPLDEACARREALRNVALSIRERLEPGRPHHATRCRME